MVFKAVYYTSERVFQFLDTGAGLKVSFLMVSAFCDKVVAKKGVESCTGKEISKFHYILSEKSALEDF